MIDPLRLPASLLFDLIYCLVIEDSKEDADRRRELEARLESLSRPARETWGKTPAQQAAMRAAMNA